MWAFNPFTGTLDNTVDASGFAKLDGSNQPFTGDVEVVNETASVKVNAKEIFVYATGGDSVYNVKIDSEWYRIHIFSSVGTSSFIPNSVSMVDVLVIGGGGGWRGWRDSWWYAPGGAGQLKYLTGVSVSGTSQQVIVGAKGQAAGKNEAGNNGSSSFFGTIESIGGQGGGQEHPSAGGNSGSGMSGGKRYMFNQCGGGGGDSSAGQDCQGTNDINGRGGNGGNGTQNSITGTSVYYAGGLGGQKFVSPTTNGLGSDTYGGSDRDGVVIVRYKIPNPEVGFSPRFRLLSNNIEKGSIRIDSEDNYKLKVKVGDIDVQEIDTTGNTTFNGNIYANNLIEEAPEDNKQYIRKNKSWEEFVIGGGQERGTFTLSNLKYIFTIDTPNNAPVTGDTYTNNDITYTVISYSDNILICSGNGYPTVIGTLTKVSGSGDDTLTFNSYKATLTVEHNLNLSAPYSICGISLFNNLGKQFLPDDIAGFANSFEVDLTSFRDLTGTNGYIYIKG